MITELTLKNFRGFERHVVPLRPLTIIVGKNNAGKSTIVEALRLLSAVTSRYQSLDYGRLPSWLDRNRRERAVYPSTKDFDFRHEAVFHRLGDAPAEISAKFITGEKVEIFIGPELEVFGIIKDARGNVIETKGQANRTRLPQVMHADLQRRLIRLLRSRKHQTIVATHSIEIMSEVEPDEILVIDRRRAKSYFAGKHPKVQSLLESIGSIQNIQLSRLGASRRFLMVEGDDIDFLKRFQNTLFPDSQTPIDTIPHKSIGGWNGWERAVGCATFLNDEAGESIKPYCLLDSDFQTPDTIRKRQKSATSHGVQLHIWIRKEIENYLLIPAAILRVIQRGMQPSVEKPVLDDIETKLDEIAERLRMDTFNAMATAFQEEDRSGGVTGANKKADARLSALWKKNPGKLTVVSGKEVIHKLSEWSNRKYGISFNAVKLARELLVSEIDEEIKSVMSAIETCNDFETDDSI